MSNSYRYTVKWESLSRIKLSLKLLAKLGEKCSIVFAMLAKL